MALDILKSVESSFTGGIVKAYIEFEDNRKTKIEVEKVENKSSVRYTGIGKYSSCGSISAVAEKTSFMNKALKMLTELKSDIFPKGRLEVHFNPNQVTFQARPGRRIQKHDYSGDGTVKYVNAAPRITMSVPLIFQDYERTDAFMMEKISDPAALLRTGVVSATEAISGKSYSVRPVVEGFIGALQSTETRKITFSWGNMSYKGVIHSVNAEYTMFNMSGNPIRAVVNLSMTLLDPDIHAGNMGYWSESYIKAFSGDNTTLSSPVDGIGNLLNIKL